LIVAVQLIGVFAIKLPCRARAGEMPSATISGYPVMALIRYENLTIFTVIATNGLKTRSHSLCWTKACTPAGDRH
jgi:hypothetical protein